MQAGDANAVVDDFYNMLRGNEDLAVAVAAILALTNVIKRSNASTMMQLEIVLKAAVDKLKEQKEPAVSLASGCDLFMKTVTRTYSECQDFSACRERLISRGTKYGQMSLTSRQHIATLMDRFIRDGHVILIHGYSRVVCTVLLHAASKGKRFSVVTTVGHPDSVGPKAASALLDAGIPVTTIEDCAVGWAMEKIDLVVCGAEAIVESGGIINRIGTYQLAIVAKTFGKPFYVAAESYKFARLFPLNQNDIPNSHEAFLAPKGKPEPAAAASPSAEVAPQMQSWSPKSDYTSPTFLTLLFTDLGVLTPSAVSDELIKLYY